MTDKLDDSFAKICGFKDEAEKEELMDKLKIVNSIDVQKFLNWRHKDGTKDGLIKLIKSQ